MNRFWSYLTGLFLLAGSVYSQTPVGTEIVNTVNLTYGGPGVFSRDDSASVSLVVSGGYYLLASKSVDSAIAFPNDTLDYTITLKNPGNIPASAVILRDTLPGTLDYLGSMPAGNENLDVLEWTGLTIPPGDSTRIRITASILNTVTSGSQVINSATAWTDDGRRFSSNSAITSVNDLARLEFDKQASKDSYDANELVEFRIAVTNPTVDPVHGTVITDTIPDGLSFSSASHSGQLTTSNGVASWTMGTMEPGQTDTVQLFTTIDHPVADAAEFVNRAWANTAGAGTYLSECSITVTSTPQLTLEPDWQEFVIPGDTVTIQLGYGNSGTAIASTAQLFDALPPELIFISASNGGSFNGDDNSVSWQLSDIMVQASDNVTLTVLIDSTLQSAHQIDNPVTISCLETEAVSDTLTMYTRLPYLTLENLADSATVSAGSQLGYTLTIQNLGDTTATGLTVVDSLPENVLFVSASGSAVYDDESHTVTWNYESLRSYSSGGRTNSRGTDTGKAGIPQQSAMAAQSERLVVQVQTPLDNNTVLHNKAVLTSLEGLAAADAETTIVASAPILNLIKSAPVEVLPGAEMAYRFEYFNSGNEVARNVTMTDTLSSYLTFLGASGSYTYDLANRIVTWDIGDIDLDNPAVIDMDVRVSGQLPEETLFYNSAHLIADVGAGARSTTVTANLYPLSIALSAEPDVIMGNGVDSSAVTAAVVTYLGNPAPDGLPVKFSSTNGTIPAGRDTAVTSNGGANTTLISDIVSGAPVYADVMALLEYDAGSFSYDTTGVVFVIGAFDGIIVDYSGNPIEKAIVDLIQISSRITVGSDTTGPDGYYLIPVNVTDDYQLLITTTDDYGHEITTEQPITIDVPENGEVVTNLNSISGYPIDHTTGTPITEAGLKVILNQVADSSGAAAARTMDGLVCDSTLTDSLGMYFFTNLYPGNYTIDVYYQGAELFDGGNINVSLPGLGQYIVNANVSLQQSTLVAVKAVDKEQAQMGDTLTYSIAYASQMSSMQDTVFIVDKLPAELRLVPGSVIMPAAVTFDSYDEVQNELRFHRVGLPLSQLDLIVFKAVIGTGFDPGVKSIINDALVYGGTDTTTTAENPQSQATTNIIVPYLTVEKRVNRKVVTQGDLLTYTVSIKNESGSSYLTGIVLEDFLPAGFRYRNGSSLVNKSKTADPGTGRGGEGQHLTWSIPDTLYSQDQIEVQYRVIPGLSSRYGENENTAYAVALSENGVEIASNVSSASVVLKPDLFSENGLIFGKVYVDENENGIHDNNETVFGGVELIMEDGTRVVTDEYGKYSIPEVMPGEHVLRINKRSLPEGSTPIDNSLDFIGDPFSRLVKIYPGGISKGNFAIRRDVEFNAYLHNAPYLSFTKSAITKDFRLVVFTPWNLTIPIEFSPDARTIAEQSRLELTDVGNFLKWQDQVYVEIIYHSAQQPDSAGMDENYTQLLAWTDSIKEFLISSAGIAADRMLVQNYQLAPDESVVDSNGAALDEYFEFVFHTDEEDEVYSAGLSYQVRFRYTGNGIMEDVKFKESIPAGFEYALVSSFLDSSIFDPVLISESLITWNLDKLEPHREYLLEYTLIPADHQKIKSISTAESFVSYDGFENNVYETESLITNISTNVIEQYFNMTVSGANFGVNSARIGSNALRAINKLGQFLSWMDDMKITIAGFTDDTGNEEQNLLLSANRASSIKTYLVEKFGIADDRIATVGYGWLHPVADNNTYAGRAANRRVEIIVNSPFRQVMSEGLTEIIRSDVLHPVRDRDDSASRNLLEVDSTGKLRINFGLDFSYLQSPDLAVITVSFPENVLIGDSKTNVFESSTRTWAEPVNPSKHSFETEFDIKVLPEAGETVRAVITAKTSSHKQQDISKEILIQVR